MAQRGKDWLKFEERAWGDDLSGKPGKSAERPNNVVDLMQAGTKTDVEKVVEGIQCFFVCIGCRGGVFTETTEES